MFGGLTHGPAVDLCRLLVEMTPEDLQHVFLTESDSVSVEVAIKMCLQYWRARGRPGKNRLMTWRGGYHGDTFGAMSLGDPGDGARTRRGTARCRRRCSPTALRTVSSTTTSPSSHGWSRRTRTSWPRSSSNRWCRARGGMRFHDPRYLHVLRELCHAHDVLLVFDEISTGFGRTGELFAADHAGIAPDVMCLGGADRRLPADGGDAVHRAPRVARRPGPAARADVHGQPARRRRRPRVGVAAARAGLARRGQDDRGRAARRPDPGPGPARRRARCASSARSG